MNRAQVVLAGRIVIFAAFVTCWDLLVRFGIVGDLFLSTPLDVVRFLYAQFASGEIWHHVGTTLAEMLLGFVLGATAGIASGLLLARFPLLDAMFDPFLTVLNSLPRVALAPLFLLWFGIGLASKVVLAFSLVYFILLINTRAGVRTVDADLVTVARLLGANNRQLFHKVILPAAVPSIMAGMRLGVVYSLLGSVVSEMIAAESGLGQRISFFSGMFNTAGVMGTLVILAVIASGVNALTAFVEARLLRWQERGRM